MQGLLAQEKQLNISYNMDKGFIMSPIPTIHAGIPLMSIYDDNYFYSEIMN